MKIYARQAQGLWACILTAMAAMTCASAWAQPVVPPGFVVEPMTPALAQPVAMAFAADGRLFVAEKAGRVRVYKDGAMLKTFINLKKEVNASAERGLMGIALHPNFMSNRRVYLLYNVDPIYGEPDEPEDVGTYSRVVSYKGTLNSSGNKASPSTRKVLIGKTPADGIAGCFKSHVADTLQFGPYNRLLISTGDGAHYVSADGGGMTPSCFGPSMLDPSQDIGAFRAQSLDSYSGKILRVKTNGKGLSTNPFWNGDPDSIRSKVWATGLRNPWKFAVKPGPGPLTLFVGDVGWNIYEEVNAVQKGDNLGWPCYEGPNLAPAYPALAPASAGCTTIGSASNPGPLKPPVMHWKRDNPALSLPAGLLGRSVTGGVFHQGNSYPVPFRNGYFVADFMNDWIKVAQIGADNQVVSMHDFASNSGRPVDFALDPTTGDICYISWTDQRVYRIRYTGAAQMPQLSAFAGGTEGVLGLLANWGACDQDELCPEDLNRDGVVDEQDLLQVLAELGVE